MYIYYLGKTGGGEGDDLASGAVDKPAGAVDGFRQHYLCLYLCMRPSVTRVCGLKLLVYAALIYVGAVLSQHYLCLYLCMRP